jgi:cytochrome c
MIVSLLFSPACGPRHETLAQAGADLANSAAVAQSPYNAFACTTCHAEHAQTQTDRIYPGAVLEGASARPSWWGGNVVDLGVAVDDCFEDFMAGERLDPAGDTAQAFDAYLVSLTTDATPAALTAAQPFTVPATVTDIDLSTGDATRGTDVYRRACMPCHGEVHTGAGQLNSLVTVLPDAALQEHATYGAPCSRVIFIEKIRHGSFYNYPGHMPPFSMEALSDVQIADLLVYLAVPTCGTCDNGVPSEMTCP